jgi:hypothetical protein
MADAKCPRCDSKVVYDYTCPTWGGGPGGGMVMSCMGCGNAVEFTCVSDDCDWYFITPFNPYNRRYEKNEANKPSWMTEELELQEYPLPDGVEYIYSD